ncbi:MAG: aspartate aminotransferase [Gammaproteobacteria bacterium]|jgi:aspartate aminotransferase
MFDTFEKLADDPILGLIGAYKNDNNPQKIDLGAGVYKNLEGITPIFEAVKRAETLKLENETSKTYTGIEGDPLFCETIQSLILGADHPAIKEDRSCAISAPGGSGALRVAGEVINGWKEGAHLWVSNPSWPNHTPLLATAGLTISDYPYYDGENHVIRTDEMMDQISKLGKEDILLLHGCCHNPSGADLSFEHWQEIARLAQHNGFMPFVDFAYQGLGKGLDKDAEGMRYLVSQVPEIIIAYSCSKNFGLYRDRVGAAMIVTEHKSSSEAAWTHMKSVARRLYSVPPAHGAILVGMILSDPDLKLNWETELEEMQTRINSLRVLFTETMKRKSSNVDYEFINSQNGMFSILGLTVEQVLRLRSEFSVYMVNSSRINIAGISPENVDYLADAIIAVL